MKHNPNKNRPRGGRPQGKRGNGFGFNPLSRSFDSTGPDVKVRGNALQVYEKYQQLARDASAAGDRVAAENFSQHAEHYYRILNHDGQWYQRQIAQQRAQEAYLAQQAQNQAQGGQQNPGNPGPQGYQGQQGYQGNPNYQGHQGHQGYQGQQGHQGHQGHQGYQAQQVQPEHQPYQGHNPGFQGLPGPAMQTAQRGHHPQPQLNAPSMGAHGQMDDAEIPVDDPNEPDLNNPPT
ncbi:MAG: DUF4167 domain-containing protein [Alphaproteobacteria bacterium]|nr:DUF4167 domain-containing protein [Alphaproteobacteria bacterium]